MNVSHYNQCVRKGKQLVTQYKSVKYDLCELTINVCDIQVGGRGKNSSLYSVKKFANDIGMNYSTLTNWVAEHRSVVEKLISKPKAEDYKVIRDIMKSGKVNARTPKTKVRAIFKQHKALTEADRKLIRHIQDARTIQNFTTDYALSQLNKDDVNKLLSILVATTKNIKKSLTVKTKLVKGKTPTVRA